MSLSIVSKVNRLKAIREKKRRQRPAKTTIDLEHRRNSLVPWAIPLFNPFPYKVLYGGRGSGKSYAVADALLVIGASKKCKILCAREFQVSIKDSVHSLLGERITALKLESLYDVQRDRIIGINGTEFIFKGVRHNIDNIKSIPSITYCWVEEGQSISRESWDVLEPTIRDEGSEIWVTFNPTEATDIVYHEFVTNRDAYEGCFIKEVNWRDNPWFSENLNQKRLRKQKTDPDAYAHIWEGKLWERSDAQIFKGKWAIEEFTVGDDWDGPYLGSDFGFSDDPTTLIQSWIHDDTLWIELESYEHGLSIDRIAERWQADIPDCDRHNIYCDNARPETIDYIKRNGIPRAKPAKKGKGSVEDGIEHIRSFDRVVIHPRCVKTSEEFRMYRYKVDGLGSPTRKIIDDYNHCIDAIRYSLCGLKKSNFIALFTYEDS